MARMRFQTGKLTTQEHDSRVLYLAYRGAAEFSERDCDARLRAKYVIEDTGSSCRFVSYLPRYVVTEREVTGEHRQKSKRKHAKNIADVLACATSSQSYFLNEGVPGRRLFSRSAQLRTFERERARLPGQHHHPVRGLQFYASSNSSHTKPLGRQAGKSALERAQVMTLTTNVVRGTIKVGC